MNSPSTQPATISSGTGATPGEIAAAVFEALNSWTHDQPPVEESLWERFWDADAVESIEGDGQMWTGLAGIRAKNEWWNKEHEILSFSVSGPFVGATGFALQFDIKIRMKSSGDETAMTEVAVYTVKDGKIVREEFMYAGMGDC